MSLPLMVVNSVIAAGACDSRPDYDYFEDNIWLFEIEARIKL